MNYSIHILPLSSGQFNQRGYRDLTKVGDEEVCLQSAMRVPAYGPITCARIPTRGEVLDFTDVVNLFRFVY